MPKSINCSCSGVQPSCEQQGSTRASENAPGNYRCLRIKKVDFAGAACLFAQHGRLWHLGLQSFTIQSGKR